MDSPTDAELRSHSAVRRLLSLYGDAVARRDADAVGDLFAEDARVIIAGGPPRNGRTEIVEGLRKTIEAFSFLHQKCDTGLIDAADAVAHARISVMEVNQSVGSSDLNMIFGVYEDEYRRTDAGWRFYRREFTLQFRAVLPTSTSGHMQTFVPTVPFAP